MYRRDGRKVAVCDPLGDSWPGAEWVTRDPVEWVERMKRSKSVMGFVDELGLIRKNKDQAGITAIESFATMSRHYGHIIHYLATRIILIPPNIRENCDNAVIFRQKLKGLTELDEELDTNGAIFEAAQFQRGTAFICQPYETPIKIQVF